MFSFFHRTNELHADFLTYDQNAYYNTPIVYTSKTIPDWWKELSPYSPKFIKTEENDYMYMGEKNLRECYGFIELYKKGVTLEHWTDISIKSGEENYNYWYTSGQSPNCHSREQFGNGFLNHHHLKLNSPWILLEKTGTKFLLNSPTWSLDKLNVMVLPGVIKSDINNNVNVNIMFPKIVNEFVIPLGQPLIHIIPLTDKKLKIRNHLVSEKEWKKRSVDSSSVSFFGWRKAVNIRKRNKERGTCPFGFGDKDE